MNYSVKSEALTQSADSIRSKTGSSAPIPWDNLTGFKAVIDAIPTGGGSTLITKSITANGTYNASSDSADGYSSVTVNVPAPSVPFVTGTFTGAESEKGTAKTISIPYTGSGYPIAGIIYPSAGAWNSESEFYSKVQRYIIGSIAFAKSNTGVAPSYSESENIEKNWAFAYSMFKNSDSDPANFNRNGYANTRLYRANSATAAAVDCVKMHSATSMSVFIANTSYGFLAGTEYTYVIQYSS